MLIHLSSPHFHGGNSIRITMLTVMIALLPASIVSVLLFGWLAVLHLLMCIFGCMLSEWAALKLMKRPTTPVLDGSAALTGLLIALVLPAAAPWWIALLGSIFAIILGKQVYGGLGYNPFNPALSARIILLISFPLMMTTWVIPMHVGTSSLNLYDLGSCLQVYFFGINHLAQGIDAISMATPLGHVKTAATQGITVAQALQSYDYSLLDAFLGREAGSLGETSALALLLGGIYLIARNTITWHIPISYLASVALLAFVFNIINPDNYAPPLFHLMAGGLMLCAFFMATDPVSSPVTPLGQIVFGIGCGILTWCIRTWGGYPEGAMFAVVLMNMAVPLIDHYCRPRVYGHKKSGNTP